MTRDDLIRLVEGTRYDIFRLETHPAYAMPGDDERIRAFQQGRQLPAKATKSAWVQQIRDFTSRGVRVSRVHVINLPITLYLDYEIRAAYPENVAAGESVRIADRATHTDLHMLTRDFMLIDRLSRNPKVVWYDYDEAGHLLGYEYADDKTAVALCRWDQRIAWANSVNLDQFTAKVA